MSEIAAYCITEKQWMGILHKAYWYWRELFT